MAEAKSSSASSETLYSVQYLRAAAALAVVFYHISALSQQTWGLDPERIDHVGAAGVDLFFVISGFVMAMFSKFHLNTGLPPCCMRPSRSTSVRVSIAGTSMRQD